jgi:hypothetical protein
MNKKYCWSCGTKEDLIKVEKDYLKTNGYPVPIKDGYVCKDCSYKLLGNKKSSLKKIDDFLMEKSASLIMIFRRKKNE